MANVLILYPQPFKCFSKFSRKILKIVSNLDSTCLVSIDDHNGYIKDLANEYDLPLSNSNNLTECIDSITHAIIFDDGECLFEEAELIASKGIPSRVINILITRVINIKNEPAFQNEKSNQHYEYIGRGSYWGNPYSMYEEGDSREEVIRKFKYDFDYDKFPNKNKNDVFKLTGKRLGCFCKPLSCHGDVLADYLNSWDDGK